jgi:hypothetical protein
MDSSFDLHSKNKDLGKTWMLTNGTLLANVDSRTGAEIIKEVEFAYLYYIDLCKILEIGESSGGMIVEKQQSTLIMGNFTAEHGLLSSAEGEWVEGAGVCFDYCLARI